MTNKLTVNTDIYDSVSCISIIRNKCRDILIDKLRVINSDHLIHVTYGNGHFIIAIDFNNESPQFEALFQNKYNSIFEEHTQKTQFTMQLAFQQISYDLTELLFINLKNIVIKHNVIVKTQYAPSTFFNVLESNNDFNTVKMVVPTTEFNIVDLVIDGGYDSF
jgi:hypothetical protein